jgi:hypothetical protein
MLSKFFERYLKIYASKYIRELYCEILETVENSAKRQTDTAHSFIASGKSIVLLMEYIEKNTPINRRRKQDITIVNHL